MPEGSSQGGKILLGIVLALAAWGVYHTIGVFRSEADFSRALVKAAIVFGAMALFLSWWGLLLWTHQRRVRNRASGTRTPGTQTPDEPRPEE